MRLDVFLADNNYFSSRNKASEAIVRGEIFVNGKVANKPSKDIIVGKDVVTVVEKEKPFVSLGGYKLDIAIKEFKPDVLGRVFIDVGASTGGFTDCLLRSGAKKVYCVDVGENLLDKSIASDDRVIVMDNTNARYLLPSNFSENAHAIVVDCSFISLEYILPPLVDLFEDDGYILALIKPQFELNERVKLKNGILRDKKARLGVLKKIYDFILSISLIPTNLVCVTTDLKKNLEYVIKIVKKGTPVTFEKLTEGIE